MLTAYASPRQDPAQCTTCTVGPPHGEWCFAAVAAHSEDACTSEPSTIFFGLDFCNSLGDNDYTAFVGTEPPQATYYCDVPEQTPTIPPLTWDTAAVGCAVPSPAVNGCGSNRVCLPRPAAPFQTRHCISRTGDKECPAETYTAKALFYGAALDGRTCTPCGFVPTPITCTATAVMYSDTACGQALATVSDYSGACTSIAGSVGSTKLLGASFSGTPSCSPVGGKPAGAVVPTGPVTVCCTP